MKEYYHPDCMPKGGELVLVRDSAEQEWRERKFYGYRQDCLPYPWHVYSGEGTTGYKSCAPRVTAISSPILYTEKNKPLPGQPILVSDDAGKWYPKLYTSYNANTEFPWCCDTYNWKYAAHYDEQFWLAQQKKEEPVDASKQAEKLSELLANNCSKYAGCPARSNSVCFFGSKDCRKITKDDWLAWAATQED